jgi:hypothetical protein
MGEYGTRSEARFLRKGAGEGSNGLMLLRNVLERGRLYLCALKNVSD